MSALTKDKPVAIIGAGAMGAGIAQVAAQAGHRVLLFDTRAGAAQGAIAGIDKVFAGLVAKGRMTETARAETIARLAPAATIGDLAPAGLAIEAAIEDLDIKRKIFADLEAALAPDGILASNTSSLSIAAIARGLQHPGRVAGMHFFNPAPLMPLVEVVSAITTDRAVAATVFDTAAAWGKAPVHCGSTPGFIVNRVARPFYGEALRLLNEGAADPATIDACLRAAGFRMGPCELMDLIGHDVNFAVTRSVHAAFFFDPRYQPSLVQQALVEAGRLGRKSGRGFYDHGADVARPAPATAPPAPAPTRIVIQGDLGIARPLIDRIAAKLAFSSTEARDGPGIMVDGVALRLSDGLPAALRPNTVLFDLTDFAKADRIAIAGPPEASRAAIGLFQAIGMAVSVIQDSPGLIVMRTVAMLANEAHDAVQTAVASAKDIDLAMMKGVNYPRGPLEWGAAIGWPHLRAVLDNLARFYGEDRYRASPRLRMIGP